MDKDCKITLHYFNARGRAELARFILAYAKKEFTDHRLIKDDWPAFKPQCPLGQMPVIEFADADGKSAMMCQSAAIYHHLANIFDLAGKTPEEKARADEAFESLRELFEHGSKMMTEQDPDAKAKLVEQMKHELAPRIFGYLEKRAKENDGKNLAGGEGYTYADLCLAMMLEAATKRHQEKEEAAKFEEMYPSLIAIGKAVSETQEMKEYLANRPETEF